MSLGTPRPYQQRMLPGIKFTRKCVSPKCEKLSCSQLLSVPALSFPAVHHYDSPQKAPHCYCSLVVEDLLSKKAKWIKTQD